MNKIVLFTAFISIAFFNSVSLKAQSITKGDIYALIIGVSEYNDTKISKLNFAHKDAEEFANYLMSESGGNVPADNIKLLTNKNATVSKIYNAKKWLEESPKKGDLVFFYFAGHGDVESSLYKLGFLLAHDTPHKNYLNNAVRIEDFNIMANTLSVEKEIDVILITDACHSGKLAGSDNRGRMLIGEQLSRSQKNEIRIASCESDQLAQEDSVWGGGRGAFSYHLVNGLKGLADGPDEIDGIVTLFELKNYLEKTVPKEVFDETGEDQIPVIDGKPFSRMAIVHRPSLNALTSSSSNIQSGVNSTAMPRSIEKLPTFVDTFFQRIQDNNLENDIDFSRLVKGVNNTFEKEALSEMETTKAQDQTISVFLQNYFNSNDSIMNREWLEKIKVPSRERKEFLRGIAARIHDQIQGAINRYLAGDNEEMDKRQYRNINQLPYENYPDMLVTAMRLIDTSNHLYHIMKVKKHYFKGVNYRLGFLSPNKDEELDYIEKALYHQKQALKLDANSAYVQNELGILSKWKNDNTSAESYFRKACALVPKWAIPRSNLSSLYYAKKQYAQGLEEGLKSLSIQNDYANGQLNTGRNAVKQDNLLIAKESFIKASKLDDKKFSTFINLGELYTLTTDYNLAENNFVRAVALLKQFPILPSNLEFSDNDLDGVINLLDSQNNDVLDSFNLNPNKFKKNDHISHFIYALEMFRDNKITLAEKHFRIALSIREDHPLASYYLGTISYNREDWVAADAYFEKASNNFVKEFELEDFYDEDELEEAIKRKDEFLPFFKLWHVDYDLILYLNAKVLYEMGYYIKSENIYIKLINRHSELFFLRAELWNIYEQLGYTEKLENSIIASRPINKAQSDHALTEFYKGQIEKEIDIKENSYKLANHYYYQLLEQNDISYDLNKNSEINRLNIVSQPAPDIEGMGELTASKKYDFRGLKFIDGYTGYKVSATRSIELFREGIDAIGMYEQLFTKMDSIGKGEMMYRVGDLYVAMKNFENALTSYEKANEYNEKTPPSVRVKSMYINEAFDNYVKSFESLDMLYGEGLLPGLLYDKYTGHMSLSTEYGKATKVINEALEMTPFENEALKNNQGLVYLRQKDWERAEKLYKSLTKSYPENVNYLYTLARIYAQKGKKRKAFKSLNKCFDQGWNNDYVLYSDPLLDPLKTDSKWKKKVLPELEGEFELLFR